MGDAEYRVNFRLSELSFNSNGDSDLVQKATLRFPSCDLQIYQI